MTLLILCDNNGELLADHERTEVLYTEHAHNGENRGVAIQYEDDSTEFVPEAKIDGFYSEELSYPFTTDYEDWMNNDQ